MTTWQKIVTAAMLVATLLAAWLLRYDMQILHNNGAPPTGYVLDRWTGVVAVVYPNGYRELPKQQAPAPRTWDELIERQGK